MKQRSAAYPSYTILESLDFAEKIYKNYGSNYRATREQIAEALGYSVGSLTQKVSAATQYGLLDMKSKEGYIVTPLFVKWYRPVSDEAKQEALIEAFKNPALYESLLQVFENNILPPLKPLASILLQKHSISENACDRAAEIFVENALAVSALKEDRTLRFNNNNIKVVDIEEVEPEEVENTETNSSYNSIVIPKSDHDNSQSQHNTTSKNQGKDNSFTNNPIPHNIPLRNKLPAQLLLPSDVSSADFDFIISYIGLIRNQY